MRTRLYRRSGGAAASLMLGVLLSPALAQVVDSVAPAQPEDGASVGTRPMFRIAIEGSDLYKMRFKIVLSRDDFETEAYVFDQLEESNGWAFENWEQGHGAIYMTRRPLDDGDYEWKAYAWNGVSWVEGEDVFRLHVDAVPPAAVNLRLGRPRRGGPGAVELLWDHVYVDQNGESEEVVRYHVYRYTRKFSTPFMRMYEIGVTDDLYFVDPDPDVGGLVFYKVTAEDRAGNHPMFKLRDIGDITPRRGQD